MTAHADAVKVEIAFGAAPDAASPTWTDVTDWVRVTDGITYTLGDISEERFQPSAGDLTLTLDNTDDRFNPLNASGPYYGDLTNNCPIRLTYNTAAVWRGVIHNGWPLTFTGPDAVVNITAVDPIGFLSAVDAPPSRYEVLVDSLSPTTALRPGAVPGTVVDMVTGVLCEDVDGQWTHSAALIYGDDDVSTVSSVAPARAVMHDTAVAITSPYTDNTACTYEAWFAPSGNPDTPDSPIMYAAGIWFDYFNEQVQVYYKQDATPKWRTCTWGLSERHNIGARANHVVVAWDTPLVGYVSVPTVYINGVDAGDPTYSAEFAGSYPDPMRADGDNVFYSTCSGGGFGPVNVYDSMLSAADAAALWRAGRYGYTEGETVGDRIEWLCDRAGWGLTSGMTGQGIELTTGYDPAENALDAIRQLVLTENGLLLSSGAGLVTFYPSGWWLGSDLSPTFDEDSNLRYRTSGTVIAQDNKRFSNDVTVSRAGAAGQPTHAADAASIAAVGKRPKSLANLLLPSASVAQVRADWELARRTYQGVRVDELTFAPVVGGRISSAWIIFLLTYQAGYRVLATVTKSPHGGGGDITTTAFLSGLRGVITSTTHEVTWYLEGSIAQMTDGGNWGGNWGTVKWGL